jgi:hypothetical protein
MKSLFSSAIAVLLMLQPATAWAKDDPFTAMFAWWNAAFKTSDGFTADAFRKHFTEDATLTLEGRQAIKGVDNWVTHFRRIQASGSEVEIVVPFKTVFRAGDHIYSYHVIRSRRNGEVGCTIAAGHAVMAGERIASVTLVRAPMDPAKGPLDPQCWTN